MFIVNFINNRGFKFQHKTSKNLKKTSIKFKFKNYNEFNKLSNI